MNCCKLSRCILTAWLAGMAIQYRTLWLWWRLYYIHIVLEARAVQNKCGSDVGRLLPFCQISYSRWYSFRVTFVTALGWGMIPDLAQGLPMQKSPTQPPSGNRDQQDEFVQDHRFTTRSHSQPPSEEAVKLEHTHVYEQESHKGLIHFQWSFMQAVQSVYLNPPPKN